MWPANLECKFSSEHNLSSIWPSGIWLWTFSCQTVSTIQDSWKINFPNIVINRSLTFEHSLVYQKSNQLYIEVPTGPVPVGKKCYFCGKFCLSTKWMIFIRYFIQSEPTSIYTPWKYEEARGFQGVQNGNIGQKWFNINFKVITPIQALEILVKSNLMYRQCSELCLDIHQIKQISIFIKSNCNLLFGQCVNLLQPSR